MNTEPVNSDPKKQHLDKPSAKQFSGTPTKKESQTIDSFSDLKKDHPKPSDVMDFENMKVLNK